jgi:hypothetical protein
MDSFPELIKLNRDEMERLDAHITYRNLTPQLILQQIVEANERAFEFSDDDQFAMESQGAPKENPWTHAVLCTTCIESLVRVKGSVWNWWLRERASDNVHREYRPCTTFYLCTEPNIALASLKTLPNCWYVYYSPFLIQILIWISGRYGWECRTQIKSFPQPTHSSRFNVSFKSLFRICKMTDKYLKHVCPPTSRVGPSIGL